MSLTILKPQTAVGKHLSEHMVKCFQLFVLFSSSFGNIERRTSKVALRQRCAQLKTSRADLCLVFGPLWPCSAVGAEIGVNLIRCFYFVLLLSGGELLSTSFQALLKMFSFQEDIQESQGPLGPKETIRARDSGKLNTQCFI